MICKVHHFKLSIYMVENTIMILPIAFINLIAMLILRSLIDINLLNNHTLNVSHKLYSFRQIKNVRHFLNRRYLILTGLDNRFTYNDLILFYVFWCFLGILILIFCIDQIAMITGLGVIWIMLPIVIMEKWLTQIDLSIDKGNYQLLTSLNSRLIKDEDIIHALRDVYKTIENKYIKHKLNTFNRAIKIGLPPELVFSQFQEETQNEYLKYIFLNIEIVYLRRGDISDLMRALELEYTSIQTEVNKRKVELEHEKNMTAISVMLVLMTALKIVSDNDYISDFYKQYPHWIIVFSIVILLGLSIVFRAGKVKY